MTAEAYDDPVHLVVMGVSGTGKSTVAELLVEQLGWDFCEGDDLHPRSNIDKMSSGQPLTDEDRWPWLEALVAWTAERDREGVSTILTCSALRRSYRDVLRKGGPGTRFIHLTGDPDLLAERMEHRTRHFMPASMLESQLATLEPLEDDEPGVVVDVAATPEQIVRQVRQQLGLERPGRG
ncbi:gluconokinase [Ornithinimicrobium tianjinense]|uniref:Gluconokinase n=1 Tax=Ornithinimicrobium tianjinense TaxID=1195761 RepID=A0A917BUC3_9MICO|nr:gluconokinase [Ornithinimicrobium tianjinense]GGF57123.1 gluconokinase [Ornithinimicrobium tianjinense]